MADKKKLQDLNMFTNMLSDKAVAKTTKNNKSLMGLAEEVFGSKMSTDRTPASNIRNSVKNENSYQVGVGMEVLTYATEGKDKKEISDAKKGASKRIKNAQKSNKYVDSKEGRNKAVELSLSSKEQLKQKSINLRGKRSAEADMINQADDLIYRRQDRERTTAKREVEKAGNFIAFHTGESGKEDSTEELLKAFAPSFGKKPKKKK